MSKKIIIFGIAAILLIVGVIFYENHINQVMSVATGGESSSKQHIEKIKVDYGYKNFKLKLKVDNSASDEKIEVVIKNPKGEQIESFEVSPLKLEKFDKDLNVSRGEYIIEFNKESTTSEYFYGLEYYGDNK